MINTIEDFGTTVATFLEIDPPNEISPYDGLFDDWGLDSLQAFQLIVIIESLAGALVPPPSIPEIYTLGDAYAYYKSLAASEDN